VITALIYIIVAIGIYVLIDIVIYVASGQGPRLLTEVVDRACKASDAQNAKEIAADFLEKLRDWNENKRKMEYKCVWVASRYAKALDSLKSRWASDWPVELVEEVDSLAEQMHDAVPQYFNSLFRAFAIAIILALCIRALIIQAFKIPSGSMIPTLYVGDQLLVTKFTYGVKLPFSGKRLLDFRKPRLGDIVVFKPPKSVMSSWVEHELRLPFSNRVLYKWKSQVDFIKRIVGLPGNKVEVKDGVLHVNDRPMPLVPEKEFEYERANSAFVRNVHSYLYIESIDGRPHTVLYESNNLEDEDWGPYFVDEGEFFAMGDNRDDSADSRTWTSDPAQIKNIRGKAFIIHFSWDSIHGRPRFNRMGRIIR